MSETLCLYCGEPTMHAFCCITCAGKYELREKFKRDAKEGEGQESEVAESEEGEDAD